MSNRVTKDSNRITRESYGWETKYQETFKDEHQGKVRDEYQGAVRVRDDYLRNKGQLG